MKDIRYADFSLNIHEKPLARPLYAQMELTWRCNLRCVYCYLSDTTQARKKNEMGYAEITGIIDKLHQAGFLWLCFTGGEPFTRGDFKDIYLYAKKRGFIISILTNAALITEELIKLFKDCTPFYLEIPIHGADAALYDATTQTPGSFERFSKAIGLLHKNKIPFKLKTKLTTLNLHKLDTIRTFAGTLKVPHSISPTIHPRLDGDRTPLRFRIKPNQMAESFAEDTIEESCRGKNTEAIKHENSLFRCGAVTGSVCINPSGHLIGCVCLRKPGFDLKKESFDKCFKKLFGKTIFTNFKTRSLCLRCQRADVCEKCPGTSALETGSWEKPITYLCEVARLRDENRKKTIIASR